MGYVLRTYQQNASDAAVRFFSNEKSERNGILVLPTGSGKSLIIADIASKMNQNVLVLQPSKEILEQNYAKYRSYGFDDCAIYSASFNKKEISAVTFATIGSIMSNIDAFDHFKAIIIDECHGVNAAGGQYNTFIQKVKRKVLGLTATPYRLSTAQGIMTKDKGFLPNGSYKDEDYFIDDYHPKPGVQLKNACILKFLTRTRPRIFHDVLYEVSIQTLLQQGFLAKLRYFDMSAIDTRRVKRNSTGRDYDEKSLSEEFARCGLANQLSGIVKRLLHPKDGKPRKGILVFTQFIDESEALAREIDGVAIVTGSTPKKERERILEDFKAGKIKVLSNVGVLTCLSDDTEILTRNKGWVGIDDVSYNDMVAQYDQNTKEITFDKPIRVIHKDNYTEDMVKLKGRYTDFLVTHDHNMLVKKRFSNLIQKVKAKDIVGKRFFIPVSGFAHKENLSVMQERRCSDKRFISSNSYSYRKKGLSYEESIKKAQMMLDNRNNRRYKNPSDLSIAECQFIGFWLGDGTVSHPKCGGARYSLCQSLVNPKMIDWIDNLLHEIGIAYSSKVSGGGIQMVAGRKSRVSKHKNYFLSNGTGGDKEYVKSNLYSLIPYLEKDGTDLYWGLDREQFLALIEGYHMANGNHGNCLRYNGGKMSGANKKLFDLLQAIAVCRGYRATISTCKPRESTKHVLYDFSMTDKRFHQMVNDVPVIEKNEYSRRVWCVTMEKGNIVTRRNGRVTIMGNCGFDYPALDTVVMARPTMSLAMWYQIVGRIIRPFEGKDGWVVDLGENIKRFGKVEDLQLCVDKKPGQWYVRGVVGGYYKPLTNVYF